MTQAVSINAAVPDWASTGLYAAPGDLITITVPSAMVNTGYGIRISSHSDDISGTSSWQRMPVVSRTFSITSTTMQVANAFGGAIYITVPSGKSGTYSVTIQNAVRAPYFVLGTTTDADWVSTIRQYPGTYAELVSPRTIIMVPSSQVATLANPTALMTWWDNVMAYQDDLNGSPNPRKRAERFNCDIQISAAGCTRATRFNPTALPARCRSILPNCRATAVGGTSTRPATTTRTATGTSAAWAK